MAARKTDWVKLNVGGERFLTTRTTLCSQEPYSMLARMFGQHSRDGENEKSELKVDSGHCWDSSKDETGAYMIDRSPKYFETILNYLRHGQLAPEKNLSLEGLLEEARFFNLTHLAALIDEKLDVERPQTDHSPLTRRQVVEILMKSPFNMANQLRFQGVNFEGADLSNLDLRNINFKYANLHKVNLTNSNLSFCDMERANLSEAVFDGATLINIKLTCANLDNATLRKCNFEDPHQNRAILEGASLKGAILEGSRMSLANLRVCCLKNANMRHCDLRSAVLAGANLENCDLSGSDLQETNLRGANFKDATFDLMPTAVHLSQVLN